MTMTTRPSYSTPDHDGPIEGGTTYQDQTVADTDTDRETEYTDPTGVAYPTGAGDSTGVASTPTKEDREQDDKDDADVTERRQKEKDR